MNFAAPPQGFASRPRFASRAPDIEPPDYASLRDYQREGVDAIRRHWKTVRNFLLADAPRLGKSLQALRSLPKQCRAIVVCPKSVRGVWQDEVTRWRPDLRAVVTKELRRPSMGEVLISTWDNLPDPPRGSARLILDDLSDVYLIADECFAAGTMIKTPEGDRRIEDVQVGDYVTSPLGEPALVERTGTRNADDRVDVLTDVGRIQTTARHPFLTQRGWVRAEELNNADTILRVVPRALDRIPDQGWWISLQPILRRFVEDEVQAGSRLLESDVLCGCESPSPRDARKSAVALALTRAGAHERAQSDERPRHEGEAECDAPRDGAQAVCAWGQRSGTDLAAGALASLPRAPLASRARDSDGQGSVCEAPESALSLQARLGLPRQAHRGGGGRVHTQQLEGADGGSTQRGVPPQYGMVRIQGIERVRPVGGSARVHNLQVAGVASFVLASGLITHNCHWAMSEGAHRTQKFRALRHQCGHCLGLSGTPMPGTPPQLWGVLCSIGVAAAAFPAGREEFVKACGGTPKYIRDKRTGKLRQVGYNWGKVSPEVGERLKTVMLRRVASDVLDLPPKQYQDVRCETPSDLRPFLDEINEKAWEGIGPDDLPPFEVMAPARAALARSRIPEALEFARGMAESMPLVVFSDHVDPILAFRGVPGAGFVVGDETSAGKGDKARQKVIDQFKRGELSIIAMTIKVGGVGLDLSRADGILFVDRAYNPGDNLQPEERATAVGKKSMVTIWRMMSDHPLDVRLQQILDTKTRLQAALGV